MLMRLPDLYPLDTLKSNRSLDSAITYTFSNPQSSVLSASDNYKSQNIINTIADHSTMFQCFSNSKRSKRCIIQLLHQVQSLPQCPSNSPKHYTALSPSGDVFLTTMAPYGIQSRDTINFHGFYSAGSQRGHIWIHLTHFFDLRAHSQQQQPQACASHDISDLHLFFIVTRQQGQNTVAFRSSSIAQLHSTCSISCTARTTHCSTDSAHIPLRFSSFSGLLQFSIVSW